MTQSLPPLIYEDLISTRDYLRDIALVLSGLQRAFLPEHPHQWQYGLPVGMRGVMTQPFAVAGQEVHASVDFVRQKIRLSGKPAWPLGQTEAVSLLRDMQQWVTARTPEVILDPPALSGGEFHLQQMTAYAHSLWWFEEQFRQIKSHLKTGERSPILLYPHHFDLNLTWFPHNDDRQLSMGYSTGDRTIPEPYLYITAYPEPEGFRQLHLTGDAYWQRKDFSGAVLRYQDVAQSPNPERTFQAYADLLYKAAALFR